MLETVKFEVSNTTDKKSMQISCIDSEASYSITVEKYESRDPHKVEYLMELRSNKLGVLRTNDLVNSMRSTNDLGVFLFECGVRIAFSLNRNAAELAWDFLLQSL